jgi:hypothetical protein
MMAALLAGERLTGSTYARDLEPGQVQTPNAAWEKGMTTIED